MRGIRRVDIAFVAGIVTGSAALALLGIPQIREAIADSNDFSVIWAGPAALASGADPYDATTWTATLDRLGAYGARQEIYAYPPYVALALLPFGALPLPIAASIWAYGGMAVAIAAMLALARAQLERVPAAAFAVAFCLLASHPAILSFYSGQWSPILVAALGALAEATRRGWQARAAAAVLALGAKPHLYLLAFPALVRRAVLRRELRFLVFLTAGCVIAALSLLPFREGLARYLAVVGDIRVGNPKTALLPYALGDLFGTIGVLLGVLTLLLLVAAALRFDPRGDAYIPAWLAVAPIITIYARTYDALVLLVPLTIAIGALSRRNAALAHALALVAFVTLVVVATLLDAAARTFGSEAINSFVPVSLALLTLAALWPDRTATPASPLPSPVAAGPSGVAPTRR